METSRDKVAASRGLGLGFGCRFAFIGGGFRMSLHGRGGSDDGDHFIAMRGQSDKVVAIIVTRLDSLSENLAVQTMLPVFMMPRRLCVSGILWIS